MLQKRKSGKISERIQGWTQKIFKLLFEERISLKGSRHPVLNLHKNVPEISKK